jgi:hypothetical protein
MNILKEIEFLKSQLPQFENLPRAQKPENSLSGGTTWACYCCGDQGVIFPHLVELILPDYDRSDNRLPLPICSHLISCRPTWASKAETDERFTREICENLHKINRNYWKMHGEYRAELEAKNAALVANFTQNLF